MKAHQVVTSAEWTRARQALLAKEKELTRAKDALAKARRELPWERVEKRYVFDTPDGERTLPELFGDRSQLLVYHFMFGPDWERGCKSCSFWADSFGGVIQHLVQRDIRFTAISRAPLEKLQAFQKRLGWSFPWVSSGRSDFNFDYKVSFDPERDRGAATYNYAPKTGQATELPGISAFYKDAEGVVFHTYSTFGRGIEMMNNAYQYLDLMPGGRDEAGLSYPMEWVRYHDEYDHVV